jgi:hypothetical protein
MELTVSAVSDLKEGKPWMMCRDTWITFDDAMKATYADGEAGDFAKMAGEALCAAARSSIHAWIATPVLCCLKPMLTP